MCIEAKQFVDSGKKNMCFRANEFVSLYNYCMYQTDNKGLFYGTYCI